MVSKFSGVRGITKKKKKEEIDPNLMEIYGLKLTDDEGNPYFLPTDEGGIITNLKCKIGPGGFHSGLRAYVDRKNKK